MPRNPYAPESPSPSKKRKTDPANPVKYGVDFFFKKQAEQQKQRSISSNGEKSPLSVRADWEEEEDWAIKRLKQEEEDEKLARELQKMEASVLVDDEKYARRLANEYATTDQETNGTKDNVIIELNEEEEDLYGDTVPSKPAASETKEDTVSNVQRQAKTAPHEQPKMNVDNSNQIVALEEIYAIPLDKDPLQFDPAVDAACAASWAPKKTPYAFLTHAFILINSTRARLKITDYLVNTLRVVIHHDPEALLPLVWLATNAIAPPFEGVELNLGGSVITKALVSASGITRGALKQLYHTHGDIGDVVFEAKVAVRTLTRPAPLTVKGVYTTLMDIARAKGPGSTETKRRLVERLLVSAKGEEVRYIGRTLVQHVFYSGVFSGLTTSYGLEP